jgi:ABC-2 type transport system permease protein
MRIVALAGKDLRQIIRDWKSALFLILLPIVFTLFFGVVFGGTADTRLPVAWVDEDPGGSLSPGLMAQLEGLGALRLTAVAPEERAEAERQVQEQRLAAAVIVPAGFSARTLAGESVPIAVVASPGAPTAQTVRASVQAALKRLLGAVEAARLSAEAYEAQRPFADAAAGQAFRQEALMSANVAWQQPPLRVVSEAASGVRSGAPSGFQQSSPGMIVMFAVFGVITSAMVLAMERKTKTLQRLLTTPIHRTEVIAGHLLAMFLVVLTQQVLLVGLGQLVFGVDYLREPLGILLLMVALALWVACLGLLIGAATRGEEQVIMWSLIAMFLFSALGGSWFPLEVAGRAFATAGHLLPTAWAMDGFQNIVVRGQGIESILIPATALLGYTIVFFLVAAWRFRFE